jgi:hypothetical protein
MTKQVAILTTLVAILALVTSATQGEAITYTQLIDNENPGVGFTWSITSDGLGAPDFTQEHPDLYGNDKAFILNANAGDYLRWTFNDLADGLYNVYASWQSGSGGGRGITTFETTGSGDTVYTAVDQSNDSSPSLGTINDGTKDVYFDLLAQVTVSDGDGVIVVNLPATGGAGSSYGDAVAVHLVPEPTSVVLLPTAGLFSLVWWWGRRRKRSS